MAYNATNPNGQTTGANSTPVVIASDQSTVKVKLANDLSNTTGTITTSTSTVVTGALSGVGSVTISIYGTYAGVNVTFEGSVDGTNWMTVPAQPIGSVTPIPVISTGVMTANATLAWNISPVLGLQYIRVRATAYTSGTTNVIIAPSAQFTQPLVNVGSGTLTVSNDATVSGSLTAASTYVTTAALVGAATATIQVTGTWAGTLTPQASVDGVTFVSLSNAGLFSVGTNSYTATITSTVTGIFQADVGSFNYFRIGMTAYTSGTAVITIKTSAATSMVALDAPVPAGSNTIGTVALAAGSNVIGYVGISPTTGSAGLTLTNQSQQALTNTIVYVKTSGGHLYEYDFYNPNSTGVWVQIINAASGATLGTTVPARTIYIPATSGRDWASPWSMALSSGIAIACTATNTGNGAPASPIQAYVGYV